MINATELRLGNYVFNNGRKLNTIELIDFYDFHAGNFSESDYYPICLDPGILEEFGFELYPWGYVKKSGKEFGFRLNLRSYNYEVPGNKPVKVEYVHQLQNLYFALTGEELKFAEPFGG